MIHHKTKPTNQPTNQPTKAKKNFTSKKGKNAQRHINNRMQSKQNKFGAKYGNRKIITEKSNG